MFPAALPFDYLKHVDGDRIRRLRARPTDRRVRRGRPGGTTE
jgi:hypothetical protein